MLAEGDAPRQLPQTAQVRRGGRKKYSILRGAHPGWHSARYQQGLCSEGLQKKIWPWGQAKQGASILLETRPAPHAKCRQRAIFLAGLQHATHLRRGMRKGQISSGEDAQTLKAPITYQLCAQEGNSKQSDLGVKRGMARVYCGKHAQHHTDCWRRAILPDSCRKESNTDVKGTKDQAHCRGYAQGGVARVTNKFCAQMSYRKQLGLGVKGSKV